MIAFDALRPCCPCGLELARPGSHNTPSSAPATVKCGCGWAVHAVFWRQQGFAETLDIMRIGHRVEPHRDYGEQ